MEVNNLLRILQANYLKEATGVMKTTPTEVLEIAFCIHSLDISICGKAYTTSVYKVKSSEEILD